MLGKIKVVEVEPPQILKNVGFVSGPMAYREDCGTPEECVQNLQDALSTVDLSLREGRAKIVNHRLVWN